MTFSYEADTRFQRLVTVWRGDVTAEDALRHIEHRAVADTLGFAQLIDATDSRVAFAPAEANRLASAMKSHARQQPIGPTALVVSSDCDFGMYRLFGTMADEAYPVNVFRSRRAALEWLGWANEENEAKLGDVTPPSSQAAGQPSIVDDQPSARRRTA
ncbi:MAG: hypothetical protein ABJF10_16955 [Chthoniobacter sp.]|uniref:hypothetical protein n=1 Tax=Chthoniobacter sp. TaxID=2510640 RepID=UPI0032AB3F79